MGVQQAILGGAEAPLTASLAPSSVSGTRSGSGVTTSDSCTCSAFGGTGTGRTYTWTYVSGDSGILPDTGSSATTTFSKNLTAPSGEITAVYKCVVDDSGGNGPVDSSNNVSISLEAT